MKCLLFDNYDSFTYNLRHMLLELGLEVDVRRNDRIALDEVAAYDRIVLSPLFSLSLISLFSLLS